MLSAEGLNGGEQAKGTGLPPAGSFKETKGALNPTPTAPAKPSIPKNVVNFASHNSGAVPLQSSPGMSNPNSVLVDDKDKYAMTECSLDEKWIIIWLSEDIQVKTVVLANYEKLASYPKVLQLMGSTSFPVEEWVDLGVYEAKFSLGEQVFELVNPSWARYLKFNFLTFHDSDSYFYCTVSQIKVHGSTALESFKEEVERSDEEVRQMHDAIHAREEDGVPVGSEDVSMGLTGAETFSLQDNLQAALEDTLQEMAAESRVFVPGASSGTIMEGGDIQANGATPPPSSLPPPSAPSEVTDIPGATGNEADGGDAIVSSSVPPVSTSSMGGQAMKPETPAKTGSNPPGGLRADSVDGVGGTAMTGSDGKEGEDPGARGSGMLAAVERASDVAGAAVAGSMTDDVLEGGAVANEAARVTTTPAPGDLDPSGVSDSREGSSNLISINTVESSRDGDSAGVGGSALAADSMDNAVTDDVSAAGSDGNSGTDAGGDAGSEGKGVDLAMSATESPGVVSGAPLVSGTVQATADQRSGGDDGLAKAVDATSMADMVTPILNATVDAAPGAMDKNGKISTAERTGAATNRSPSDSGEASGKDQTQAEAGIVQGKGQGTGGETMSTSTDAVPTASAVPVSIDASASDKTSVTAPVAPNTASSASGVAVDGVDGTRDDLTGGGKGGEVRIGAQPPLLPSMATPASDDANTLTPGGTDDASGKVDKGTGEVGGQGSSAPVVSRDAGVSSPKEVSSDDVTSKGKVSGVPMEPERMKEKEHEKEKGGKRKEGETKNCGKKEVEERKKN